MTARYLVRFDDICPTMDWAMWERVETILLRHGVKPILAVVPENRDQNLMVGPPLRDFWRRVRQWQEYGWKIAVHGYQHLFTTQDAGLLGINHYSEFAGLPYGAQREKLDRALAVFKENGVHIDTWVAPAHSFDETTVRVLLELDVHIISDGFYLRPVNRLGAIWIPQQMWRLRPMPFGVWTVCYHHNQFSEDSLKCFAQDISRYASLLISSDELAMGSPAPEIRWADRLVSMLWMVAVRVKRTLR